MKKFLAIAATAALIVGMLSGCGAKDKAEEAVSEAKEVVEEAAPELEVIKVGATPAPHAEILKEATPLMAEKGYSLEIVEFTDYVQPNSNLESGDIDANYFQHTPYLDDFNAENGTHIVPVAAIHYEPLGLYPGKTATIEELADGASIAVPNDTTNEARALLLLAANGIIEINEDAGLKATKLDITSNPLNIEIVEMEAAQLARTLQDVDMAVINGNYAIQADLNAETDAIAKEEKDSLAAETYANVLCVKEGNEEDPRVKALIEVLTSDEIKTFIEDNYQGAVVPMF
ncbi:MAG: MetQ/NlpA family ABC transporter substrate-binding protein [Firmicutes bacterium]|nr:MetQ/NlpA family ABC transporter substrate-binding protein [Bacillota bacterium]MBR0104700.1 MetQ/NlpA family ABC transporter substrate-binding protein [Bacillota bacterium]MBR2593495.1 MetQ/NlpA family ABC transporter substrate-binding protein [Bacillota bacterium]